MTVRHLAGGHDALRLSAPVGEGRAPRVHPSSRVVEPGNSNVGVPAKLDAGAVRLAGQSYKAVVDLI